MTPLYIRFIRLWFFLIIIFILFLLQVTVLDCFKIFDIKPDLILIGAVSVGLFFDLKYALFFSAFLGLLRDIFLADIFGIGILIFPLWSFFIARLSRKMTLDYNYIRAIFTFIISIFNIATINLIRYIFGANDGRINMMIFMRFTLIESIYTAVLAFLFFKAMDYYTFRVKQLI